MESYILNDFEVKPKHSSEEALQKWRKLCGFVKNPKRRFRFTANLSKRYEAQAMRRTNQIMTKKGRGDSRARSNSRARKEKLTMWRNPAEYYCRACPRRFDKLRALCGHMRAHGDRPWRGLLPPPHPRPPTYESSTSTGMRRELGANFQREPQEKVFPASPNLLDMLTPDPQVKGFLAPPKFDLNMIPATEPQEKVPVSLKLEMQAAPEPKEKVLTSPKIDLNVSLSPTVDPPEADLDSHEKFNFDLNEALEEDEANDYRDPPEADLDSHKKFNFDLNEAPEDDEANDY